jgi:transglutaminase-like putative cysteine protease
MKQAFLIPLVLLCCAPATSPAQATRRNVPDAYRVSFTIRLGITAQPGTRRVTLTVLVPRTLPGRQKVLAVGYSLDPVKLFEEGGNRYARFVLEKPGKSTDLTVTVDAEVYRCDLGTATAARTNRRREKKETLAKWLIDERYLEKNAAAIKEAAKKLRGKTAEETVRKTMAFVVETLRRGPFDPASHGAVWALQKKVGDCTEFADLFVALCRANDVPARFCEGYLIHDIPRGDTPKHDWAEAYLDGCGWVPFDPAHVKAGSATVERLRPIYVYLDNQRNNKTLDNHHYFSYRYEGGKVQVNETFLLGIRNAVPAK